MPPPDAPVDEAFAPKGAIAFFIAMLIFFAAIWGGLYVLLLRHA